MDDPLKKSERDWIKAIVIKDKLKVKPRICRAFFIGLFTAKSFVRADKKEPAIDIAGLCLPLKPQKEKGGRLHILFFYY